MENDKPIEYLRFYHDGSTKHEIENFQNYLFKDVDLRTDIIPISFFRSDFRSTKFLNSHFNGNNFDRADFIDAYLEDCSFNKCHFGTDFINTYFKNVNFTGNDIGTCTFNECLFDECHFSGDIIKNTGYRQCEYINCTLENCHYEMNTLDDLSFKDTFLININFANSGAHNFNFDNCQFQQLVIDPDYLGSYLFKKTSLKNVSFSYRGHEFNFSDNITQTFEGIGNFYATNQRYAELLNIEIIYHSLLNNNPSVYAFFLNILKEIINDDHILRKRNNINNIFRILQFYIDTCLISMDDYFSIMGILDSVQRDQLDFRSKIEFDSNLIITKELLEKQLFDKNDPINIMQNKPMYLEIQIDENDYEKTKGLLNDLFLQLQRDYYPKDKVEHIISIVGTHKGSLYIEIVGSSLAVMALCRALKYIFNNAIKIYVQYSFVKKVLNLLEEKKSLTDVNKAAQTMNLILKDTSENVKKDFSGLAETLKSVNIFPNAFKE